MQQVEKGFDHRDSHPSPLASCSVEYAANETTRKRMLMSVAILIKLRLV